MKIYYALRAAVSALLLGGCSTLSIDYDYDPAAELGRYETFGVLPIPHPPFDPNATLILGPEDFSLLVLNSVLEGRGYRNVPDAKPDFYVGIRAEIRDFPPEQASAGLELPPLAMGAWAGSQRVHGSHGTIVPIYNPPQRNTADPGKNYEKRSDGRNVYLIVEVLDGQSLKLVWHGWARGETMQDFAKDGVRAKTIEQILARFPG